MTDMNIHTEHKIVSQDFFEENALNLHPQKIVFTNGCFDILHVGHINTLLAARREGDLLIVGLNSDSSVKRLKGPSRPINSHNERAQLLAALHRCRDLRRQKEDHADGMPHEAVQVSAPLQSCGVSGRIPYKRDPCLTRLQ